MTVSSDQISIDNDVERLSEGNAGAEVASQGQARESTLSLEEGSDVLCEVRVAGVVVVRSSEEACFLVLPALDDIKEEGFADCVGESGSLRRVVEGSRVEDGAVEEVRGGRRRKKGFDHLRS